MFLKFLGTSLIEVDLQKIKEKARFCLFINHWDFHPHFTSVSHIDMFLLSWHCKMYHINKYTQYKPKVSLDQGVVSSNQWSKTPMAHFLFPSNRITQNKITNENILWVNKKKIQISLILKMSSNKKHYTKRK